MHSVLLRLLVVGAAASAAAALFFHGKVREDDARVDGMIRAAVHGVPLADTEAVALALSRAVFMRTYRRVSAGELSPYERLESSSFFNVTSAVSLGHGAYGLEGQAHTGPCGTMTRVTLHALDRMGIPARKLHLHDEPLTPDGWHAMVEFQSGGRWLVVSPGDSAFVWRTQEGRIATLDEIQADSTIFAQVFARFPDYPYRAGSATRIRWDKLPRPVRAFMRTVLGPKRYDGALTPKLYDQPRRLFFAASLSALAAFAWGALLVWSRGRRAALRAGAG